MKGASSTLINFMESTNAFVRADLYTFTLPSGTVLRYSGTNMPITATLYGAGAAHTWNLGPPIQDAGVQSARGTGGASVDVTILGGDGRFTVNGLDIIDFIDGYGLDGATCSIDRAIADTWQTMFSTGPIGTYNRFYGFCGEVKELGQTQAVITIQSWMNLLSAPFPPETFGVSCQNVFGDSNCGVSLSGLTVTGAVNASGGTGQTFSTNLSQATGYWNLGAITFTSGVNSGVSRTVKTQTGGSVTVSSPFPAAPGNGDAFTIVPGCLLSLAACQNWDTIASPAHVYTERFRGTPFVPPPTTGLPS